MQFKDPATRKKILKLLAKDAKAKKGTKNSDRGGKSKGAQRGRKQSPEDSALGRETPKVDKVQEQMMEMQIKTLSVLQKLQSEKAPQKVNKIK